MKKWSIAICLLIMLGATGYYFFPEKKLPVDKKISKLVVFKKERVMKVYSSEEVIKVYHISIGKNSVGDKISQGDKRTPEGSYIINDKNAGSGYHKNLGISYPNQADRSAAKSMNVDPGGDIKIHGLQNGLGFIGKFHRVMNWTAGCIALTDDEVDELYNQVEIGTPIIIMP
jgi:murein L,D-transpeptidase YafK